MANEKLQRDVHPAGEELNAVEEPAAGAGVETFGGRIHVQWDPEGPSLSPADSGI